MNHSNNPAHLSADPDRSVLICMSNFKGTLTQEEATEQVARALKSVKLNSTLFPIGDGGRGTLECIRRQLGGHKFSFEVDGPLRERLQATVLCFPNVANPNEIYLESSEVCGYHLVPSNQKDPMRATTFGLGQLIKQVVGKWGSSLKRIYVGLGDSSTSDVGIGMLCALGFKFFDPAGREVWADANGLRQVRTLCPPKIDELNKIEFTVLCDVLNPLCGPQGSAHTFAPQKGATREQVSLIEEGSENFAKVIQEQTGKTVHLQPMCGSAGGLGAAFFVFLNAHLVQGARFLLDWLSFEVAIRQHGVVITGEGKTDAQTLNGKASLECIERAARHGKKSIILSGVLGEGYEPLLRKKGLVACYACGDAPTPAEALFIKAKELFSEETLLKQIF